MFACQTINVFCFQFCDSGAKPVLELRKLACTNPPRRNPNSRSLPRHIALLRGQIPLAGVIQLREAPGAVQVRSHLHTGAATSHHHPIQIDLRLQSDQIPGQAGRQLTGLDGAAIGMRLGQVAGDGVRIGLGCRHIAQG